MVNAVDDREELYEKIKKAKEDFENANDELAEDGKPTIPYPETTSIAPMATSTAMLVTSTTAASIMSSAAALSSTSSPSSSSILSTSTSSASTTAK